ncbi:cysteine desulfurase family protein [Agreia sp. VKM Ac-1783]|uniref:cysteine desulfurase family protein n=1 Tax=Agreia sp. VKM Ac-1783 TaxID=1938889 RepID=UPI000A2ABF63|nr:cysteine desulfurase family protein [Agreia sp. VKM Ac-1783]SMQ75013.1 cysteine desulfurase [Agreia sp. VKM Ac-1783]
MIYLDHAATSPVRPEVLQAMWPYLTGEFGNPSSHHALGDAASRALADARARLAGWFGARPSEVTFTSGGTEAINLAIKGIALGQPRGRHIVTTPIEHEATLESVDFLRRVHGFEVSFVPVDATGRVDLAALAGLLRRDTTLVSVMAANNEIGTVQDTVAIGALAHEAGTVMHVDAVQAAGWLDVSLDALGADAVSISGHKLGAPKGVGALAARSRVVLEPLLHGGGQERGRRSGTENVAAAVGLAIAAELSAAGRAEASERVATLRDDLIERVEAALPSARLTGSREHRLPSIASFLFVGTSGEGVLLGLEERGIVSSSGSACAAGRDEPSPVLLALGIDPVDAQTAVRFSLSPASTAADVEAAAAAAVEAVRALTQLR